MCVCREVVYGSCSLEKINLIDSRVGTLATDLKGNCLILLKKYLNNRSQALKLNDIINT